MLLRFARRRRGKSSRTRNGARCIVNEVQDTQWGRRAKLSKMTSGGIVAVLLMLVSHIGCDGEGVTSTPMTEAACDAAGWTWVQDSKASFPQEGGTSEPLAAVCELEC